MSIGAILLIILILAILGIIPIWPHIRSWGYASKGKLHQVKGKIKETGGKIDDNPKLEAEGAGERK